MTNFSGEIAGEMAQHCDACFGIGLEVLLQCCDFPAHGSDRFAGQRHRLSAATPVIRRA